MTAQDHLQLLAGILGFFALVALIVAVGGIIGGDPGVLPSVTLLGLLIALWFTVKKIR
ncbi:MULTISPECIES: hypothetical protein [unclassified Rhodococcus (in: high G+C Gram-positive bacteria)]|uniref:hypothetical protein n=1 Tax=unclassified Rhodococcus (in: high G+C Gram-positive bacteria) TaxID=192944 RepID=UPI0015C6620F|nr:MULTISPECIES: hypothetical protein [unclassified Rhodococcus (in: high G+C Gram-positive bacteria)]